MFLDSRLSRCWPQGRHCAGFRIAHALNQILRSYDLTEGDIRASASCPRLGIILCNAATRCRILCRYLVAFLDRVVKRDVYIWRIDSCHRSSSSDSFIYEKDHGSRWTFWDLNYLIFLFMEIRIFYSFIFFFYILCVREKYRSSCWHY